MEPTPVQEPEVRIGNPRIACAALFLQPKRAFVEIGAGAHWVWPFLVCVIAGLVAGLLQAPGGEAAFEQRMAELQTQNPKLGDEALEAIRTFSRVLETVAIPIVLFLVLLMTSGLFWLVFRLTGLDLGFRLVFRGQAYASLISYAAYSIVVGFVMFFAHQGGGSDPQAMRLPRLGLDLLGGEGLVRGLLGAVNVFSVWWLWVLVHGFSELVRWPTGRAAGPVLVAGGLWLVIVGLLNGVQLGPKTG